MNYPVKLKLLENLKYRTRTVCLNSRLHEPSGNLLEWLLVFSILTWKRNILIG